MRKSFVFAPCLLVAGLFAASRLNAAAPAAPAAAATVKPAAAPAAAAPAEDPLAELAALGNAVADTAEEGGGSIRAKKNVDLTRDQRLKDPKNIEAKVDVVKLGTFPNVALRLVVLKASKEGAGKDVKANEILAVVPKMKVEGGKVVMTDADTALNAGAFYVLQGDKVAVRLGTKQGKVWEAEYVERK